MNKDEIKKKLTELGIDFDPSSSKDELKALLPENIEEDGGDKEESLAKREYRKIIEAYKKQNPKKFAIKEKALLAKLETL